MKNNGKIETQLAKVKKLLKEAKAKNKVLKKKYNSESETNAEKIKNQAKFISESQIQNGLNVALSKAGADKGTLNGAVAMLKSKVKLDDNYKATIDDKDLETFAKEWLTKDGKAFQKFEQTSGGGSSGNDSSNANKKDMKKMTEKELVELHKTNPEAFKNETNKQGDDEWQLQV